MLNLLLVERLLVRVVAVISLSHVCWQVFSPGAEINQNSVMAAEEREMESLKQKDINILIEMYQLHTAPPTLSKIFKVVFTLQTLK